ncbi:vesicular integral-membrane protein VIP36 [Eurytemora carolleeae]|uniref:vesicular integral-membrane protein VIP36 n=1 Tax=Eurytemora carolleeae TaxID=1294199 RepID=UPI000C76B7DD|nr:vesicular integral-membrane protein VIP36 [Eurytemora carolleeae]|eukprot:XP_023342945.1 vesicular integral-membrane protein VIP36-like [Eurytemora affinis]
MGLLKQFHIFCISLFLVTTLRAEWNTKDFQKREHSLVKPYQGAGFGVPNWDFLGSTMVTSNYVRLTPDQRSKQGALWNSVPCKTRNWELQVQFKVTGTTKDLFGDGFAIWYAKDRMEYGPVFGSKDLFSGLAVIVDTYSNHNGPHNHNHPYVSAMINNGTLSYDHDRDGTHTMLGGCEVKFRNFQHETWLAIRYENDKLTVSHDLHNKNVWAPCFSIEGVLLPTGYYFGVSATTGDLSDNHDIIAIKTYELDTADGISKEERANIEPHAQYFESPRDHKADPEPSSMSGMKTFLLLLFGILCCIACVVIGVMIYQNQQENSRKRFY